MSDRNLDTDIKTCSCYDDGKDYGYGKKCSGSFDSYYGSSYGDYSDGYINSYGGYGYSYGNYDSYIN